MTQLIHAFNPLDFDPSQGGGSWPLGKHPVIIESAEVKPTKDNSSGYLQLNLKVIDGPNVGTTGPYRLNLYNQSQEAAQIAHRQLSAICHVTQTFQLGPDGTQLQYLFNKPFVIEVGMQKGEEAQAKGYTEIKRVFDMSGNEPGKANGAPNNAGQQAQPQQAQQGQQGGNGAGAWGAGAQGGGWGQPAGDAGPAAGQGAQAGGWAQGNNGGGNGSSVPSWGQR